MRNYITAGTGVAAMAKVLHRSSFRHPAHALTLETEPTVITRPPRSRLSLQPANFYPPHVKHTTISLLCPATQLQTQIPQIQQLVCLPVKRVRQLENTVMVSAIRL